MVWRQRFEQFEKVMKGVSNRIAEDRKERDKKESNEEERVGTN
jgi:hypothetical protein